jgi:glycosyltransferase involved in cell wall biosynthesis
MGEPLVSICCITFNHEKFIKQTLDGFIMQRTNFPFEVFIHDDASTDNTANIIREYEKKYPDILKPIYQTENQFSKGISISATYIFPRIKGKYVALCEGDDYWTDPLKLQKQVDFLERHPKCSICFHPVKVVCAEDPNRDEIFPIPKFRFNKTVLSFNDLVKHNFIQTNSVMYRWVINSESIKEVFPPQNLILPEDWYIHLIHAEKGMIGYIDEVMSVYRKHSGGIWWNSSRNKLEHYKKYGSNMINFFVCIDKYLNFKYTKIFTREASMLVSDMIEVFKKNNEDDQLKRLQDKYESYYFNALRLNRVEILKKIISAPERYIRKKIKYFFHLK